MAHEFNLLKDPFERSLIDVEREAFQRSPAREVRIPGLRLIVRGQVRFEGPYGDGWYTARKAGLRTVRAN